MIDTTELELLLRRVCDPNKDVDIPALTDRVIEIAFKAYERKKTDEAAA